ncbi:MAG: uracil-DNA glycosylase [Anaeromyxobacteraceae bacterium]
MSGDGKGTTAARGEILAEVVRHLEWMRDSGERELLVLAGARPSTPLRYAQGERGVAVRAGATATPTTTPIPIPNGSTTATPSVRAERSAQRGVEAPPRASASTYALTDKGCASPALLAVRADLGECTRCKLAGGRTTLVFGTGNPRAELMFVGEGPGADEDQQGEPFVGKAGQLLTKMIEAMGFRRDEVYIANVVKCRPPGNRDPEPDEIEACEPFLKAQIAAVGPRIVVALGRFAVQTLLRDPTPISKQRGRWRAYEGVKLMPTFHPAYLLRNPPEKKRAWEDLQLVMKEFGKLAPKG